MGAAVRARALCRPLSPVFSAGYVAAAGTPGSQGDRGRGRNKQRNTTTAVFASDHSVKIARRPRTGLWTGVGPPQPGIRMVGQTRLWTLVAVFCMLFLSLSSADIHRANAKKLARKAAAAQAAIGSHKWCPENVFELRSWSELFSGERVDAWICSLIGSVIVGLSGIFPLLVIPIEAGAALKSKDGSHSRKQQRKLGLWVIVGLLAFFILEKVFPDKDEDTEYHKVS
ncbi:hypothetical protein scyTo_0017313 [Scyliorhinus torazame]|uniref:Uncharacterized protein n=1 Tax=Scyliorhinus torazame TaxID=75743 RepID=A0A401PQ02_SCYTO|nr:hypothetical protein [Scyliorhinus torazame]